MYSNTISLRYFFPRARIVNEIAEFEKMLLNRKTLISVIKANQEGKDLSYPLGSIVN